MHIVIVSSTQQLLPVFSIVSNDFDKDLGIIKGLFSGLQELTKTNDGFKLSDQAVLAAGWWFYDVYLTQEFASRIFQTILPAGISATRAALIITDALEGQLRKYGSEARIRMHKDLQLAMFV